ncbi:MAG TPA: hypothetical protein VKV26_09085 [Dehalococcoidia bacterium]|nr:hypothetical protein [Dehalococcoidia bacterium]
MPQVEIVCLANSRKYGERCVAGYDLAGQRWQRPVSDTATGTQERRDRVCSDGTEPREHQPENSLLAPGFWQRRRTLAARDAVSALASLATAGPELLGRGGDRVPAARFAAHPAAASLAVVEPANFTWLIEPPAGGQRRTRAASTLRGTACNLAVTDLDLELRLALLPPGRHPREVMDCGANARIFLTVSLGEPFGGDGFRLVAAVIALPA